jgi:hypothetical protein
LYTVAHSELPLRVSQKEEQLIITVSLVAHKGCDQVLTSFSKAAADKGLLQTVKAGKLAF